MNLKQFRRYQAMMMLAMGGIILAVFVLFWAAVAVGLWRLILQW